MSKLKIVKEKKKLSTGWRPVTVAGHVVEQLKDLSEQSGVSVCSLATKMIEFAIENMEIVEDDML
jgi:hypothetical protein